MTAEYLCMDPRLPPLLRLLRMAALASRPIRRLEYAASRQLRLR